MHEVKNKLRSVEWSATVAEITKDATFPLLVKPTKETANLYNISEEPVLLDQFWIVQRIVAHSLEEEGAYVVGPQVDIPSEYTGMFKYLPDQKGNKILDQTFSSLRAVAYAMPQRVFCLKRTVTYPVMYSDPSPADDKIKSVILQPGEQLNILDKTEVFTTLPASRFLFIGKSKAKYSTVHCLSVMVESTKEVINLPLSTRGTFATLVNAPVKDQLYDFQSILTGVDLPINLTTTRNCPKTLVDESFLQPGMQLRFSSIEEHELIIGITVEEKFVEFASEGVEFYLPVHLDRPSENREQEIAYQTALQRFILECQMKDSLINVNDYQKSIRKHISRNVRPTKPTALHMVAALRNSKYTMKKSTTNELTAIACFSSVDQTPLSRRSSMPPIRNRTTAPLPAPPNDPQQYTPPLPPRKVRSLRIPSGNLGYPTRPPPSPPDEDTDFPSRPPPFPPNETSSSRTTPFSDSVITHSDGMSNGLQPGSSTIDSLSPFHGSDRPNSTTSDNLNFRAPSPPHHIPPSPVTAVNEGNRENINETTSIFADSFVANTEESNIFGYVGDFVRGQNESSNSKNQILPRRKKDPSLYENVTWTGGEVSVSSGHDLPIENELPQARPQSPEFSLSTSYDNHAYVSSPTQQEMTNDSDDILRRNSHESLTFDLPVDVANNNQVSHTSAWEENTNNLENKEILSDDSEQSPQIKDNSHGVDDENFMTHRQGDVNKKQTIYENVVLPFSSSATHDDQSDDATELKLPLNDVTSNSRSALQNTKCSDSNNNDVKNQSILLPGLPTFVLTGTSESSSAMLSRKYSTSSDSAASTKSSFIESDSSSQRNEYILDTDEERLADDRAFWISRFSFTHDGQEQVSFACNYAKPPGNWTPPDDLSSLSVSEVSSSLRFIGMNEETVEWFSAEKVDGQLLCSLDCNDLSEHFHLSPFQLKKLAMFLKGWRPKES